MKQVLEPLARVPGVRVAMLTSDDGVPIAVRGKVAAATDVKDAPAFGDSAEDLNALAGLAAGWLNELTRAVAPLSWNAPRRIVLSATRGTMILLHGPGAVLLVLLQCGMHPEELRLPMDAALNRMQRVLRGMGNGASQSSAPEQNETQSEPSGIFPGGLTLAPESTDDSRVTGNEVPETSGEV